ncbi:unnamed protein product [Adineta steineri]|uniref:Uncharacterized protein n=1 Tax=Adineta steineri TaxID=433720 RepID=A0A814PJ51_9BILA|nr:unnamed protein product [Adineta steineri]CAF3947941.1 unnamed protein product [Adineta steineri]
MAKKAKDPAAAAAKKKPQAPVDPVKVGNLVRLLNILALVLAISAFLLQLFAVLSHHWKWQVTGLGSLVSPSYHYAQPNIYNDSRLDQYYGLYSRDVKLYANNDEQLDVDANTRFPRLDDGEESLHHCLSQTSTLRGAFLACSDRVVSPEQCHCRRHAYWNFVIFFEVLALILLGIVVIVAALLSTEYRVLLKLAGAGLAIAAFLLLFIGLLLILTHLKRETRSLADAYPYIHQRLSSKLAVPVGQPYAIRTKETILHQAVRRQAHETYRAYPLLPGQHPYNETHFQEYSEPSRGWVYKPYSSINVQPIAYAPLQQRGRPGPPTVPRRQTTPAPLHNEYGPLVGYDTVFDHTRAGIGAGTILSILAMILALLTGAILALSWMQGNKIEPPKPPKAPKEKKTKTTTTTTTSSAEYVPLATDVHAVRPIPSEYDSHRPIGDAIVTAQHVQQPPYGTHETRQEPVIVRDVVIRDEHPVVVTTQERSYPVTVETHQTAYNT